jgi:hypothetical protein
MEVWLKSVNLIYDQIVKCCHGPECCECLQESAGKAVHYAFEVKEGAGIE